MRTLHLPVPVLVLLMMTRGMLGAGIALLLADELSAERRKAVGWTLLLIGVATTIPLGMQVWGRPEPPAGGAA